MCLGATATAMVGADRVAIQSDGDDVDRLLRGWTDDRAADLPRIHLPEVTGPVGGAAAADLFWSYVDARADSCDPFVRWAATLVGNDATAP